MKKAILILSGTPSGKNHFDKIALDTCWIWHVNVRNHLGRTAKRDLFWNGERDELYGRFIEEFLSLSNRYFSTEENYFKDLIVNKFNSDSDEYKEDESGKKFNNFLLVMHGLSKNLVEMFKEEFGAIQLHISNRSLNSNVELHDLVLYEDDSDFEQKVINTISVLVK